MSWLLSAVGVGSRARACCGSLRKVVENSAQQGLCQGSRHGAPSILRKGAGLWRKAGAEKACVHSRSSSGPLQQVFRFMARKPKRRTLRGQLKRSPAVEEAFQEFDNTIAGSSKRIANIGNVLLKPLIAGCLITGAAFAGAAYVERDIHTYYHHMNRYMGEVIVARVERGESITPKEAWFGVRHGVFLPGQFDLYMFLGVCGAVFVAWQFRRLHPFMMRNFVHSPIKGKIRTMYTSAISHSTLPHLLFNSIAMFTIGQGVYRRLGPGEFWAFCSGAAVFSSLGSVLHMLVSRRAMAGLGASGVIMGLLALNAFLNPEGRYSIIFLPIFEFTGFQVLGGVMTLDVLGLLLGWSTFGHAAHLGGAVFGLFYYFEGKAVYDRVRTWVKAKTAK